MKPTYAIFLIGPDSPTSEPVDYCKTAEEAEGLCRERNDKFQSDDVDCVAKVVVMEEEIQ